ncbi:hypothetical protein [Phenylobacterium sp.]|uniref:hypothetical protein n=1 Tax=Phenylobacterium sp. TaxID=1871053 RepID=UPI00286EA378|nr:hypothetical protein [Phenylobacterium sp.]
MSWSTANIALVISGLALTVSLAGLAWNVWSKFIYPKPKLQISLSVVLLIDPDATGKPPATIRLSATNHGPIAADLAGAVIRSGGTGRRAQRGIPHMLVQPFYSAAFKPAAGLDLPIAVGKSVSIYFPHGEESFFRRGVDRIGVYDGFGRNHWASLKQLEEVKLSLREEYPDAWTSSALAEAQAHFLKRRPAGRWAAARAALATCSG